MFDIHSIPDTRFTLQPERTLVGYLVRHGELTNMRVWDGWGDMNLSEMGYEQAEKAAQWLSYTRIGRAVSSDLPRSMETAQALMNTGAVKCPYLACDPNLRPWMVAHFTGLEKTPERLAAFKKYLDDRTLVIPDGESHEQLDQRIQVIYQYIAAPYDSLPTAFFIHNSVIKALMGIEDVKAAVAPGGIVAIYMDERGAFSFEVVLGHVEEEKGIS